MSAMLLHLHFSLHRYDDICLLCSLYSYFSVDSLTASGFQSYLSDPMQTFTGDRSKSSPVVLQCVGFQELFKYLSSSLLSCCVSSHVKLNAANTELI